MRAIRSAKDACAAANEAEVVENVRIASMMARKFQGDIGICCSSGGAVEDEFKMKMKMKRRRGRGL